MSRNEWALAGACILLLAIIVFTTQYPASVQPVPEFRNYPAGPERKKVFFEYFLPILRQVNQSISEDRLELTVIFHKQERTRRDEKWLQKKAEHYGMPTFDANSQADWNELFARLDTIPVSLALAQAANESAWGTSRFARQGSNYFGQWCFKAGCGLIPEKRDQDASHEVASFKSPRESVERYFLNLNTHPAYQEFRQLRASLRASNSPVTGMQLAETLTRYSARGEDYVNELKSMIRGNKLSELDSGRG